MGPSRRQPPTHSISSQRRWLQASQQETQSEEGTAARHLTCMQRAVASNGRGSRAWRKHTYPSQAASCRRQSMHTTPWLVSHKKTRKTYHIPAWSCHTGAARTVATAAPWSADPPPSRATDALRSGRACVHPGLTRASTVTPHQAPEPRRAHLQRHRAALKPHPALTCSHTLASQPTLHYTYICTRPAEPPVPQPQALGLALSPRVNPRKSSRSSVQLAHVLD